MARELSEVPEKTAARYLLKLGLVLLGSFATCGGLGLGCFQSMMKGEAFELAMARAEQEPKVEQALGKPLESAFFIGGQVKTNNGNGAATLQIPVSGPKGTGVLEVTAFQGGGNWGLNSLAVTVDRSREVIVVPVGGRPRR